MSILDRICILLGDKEQQELTNYLGLKKTAFTDWKSGKSNSYRKYLIEIAEFFNVSLDYLVFGKKQHNVGNMTEDVKNLLKYYKELNDIDKGRIIGKAEELAEAARLQKALAAAPTKKAKPKAIKPPDPQPPNEPEDEDETEYMYMPFFDLPVSAGTGVPLDSEDAKKIRVPADDDTRQSDYVLRVIGSSMEPRYYEGDLVLVKQQQYVEEGEVGIFLYNGEGYIKIFGGDRLISLNPKYKDMMLSENDQFICLGKVEGILSIGNKKQ